MKVLSADLEAAILQPSYKDRKTMSEQQYNLFFNGQTLPGFAPENVQKTLQKQLKLSDTAVANLFSGHDVRLKQRVDKATAIKFQQLFKACGGKLIVKLDNNEGSTPAVAERAMPKPSANTATQPASTWDLAAPGALLVDPKPAPAAPELDLGKLSLAAPGAELTQPGFEPPTPIIDTSGLHLTSNTGNIETLTDEQAPVTVDISHLSVAPVK